MNLRNTTRRNRHRKIVARGNPPCHLCGNEIDYQAHFLEPLSFQIDHIIPLNRGGSDVLDNLAAAHRRCNRLKSDGSVPKPAQEKPQRFVTSRAWTA